MASSPATVPEPPAKAFAEFLESTPPNAQTQISDLFESRGVPTKWVIGEPDIQLHCTSDKCSGERSFRNSSSTRSVENGWNFEFVTYTCRNCESKQRTYALAVFLPKEKGSSGLAIKLGETPPFGPHVPSRVITLIGPDREQFLRGRRAESLGLGIGAFAYYRRVVENQKGRILAEIGRVAKRLNASAEKLRLFEKAESETQFTKAIEIVKPAIPESLLIKGQNPLTLLHSPLSEGLHDLTDEQCLELATSVRVVLTELADRISYALQDQKELDDAVGRLLNRESKVEGDSAAVAVKPKPSA
jgi:hypothetical protein